MHPLHISAADDACECRRYDAAIEGASSQTRQSPLRGVLAWLDDHRYLALCAVLFALMLGTTLNANWVGDFWEHAAAVRELARAPFDPHHPLFAVNKPHIDFAPYLLILGLFSRLTGLSAVSTLEIAGMVNLVLFLVGLRLFVRVFTDRPRAPFYALLFLLLLYGWSPWEASGLFNLNTIGFGLSYPSTIAVTVGFFTVALFAGWLRGGVSRWSLAAVALLAAAAAVTHPASAVFIYPTLVALVLASGRGGDRAVLAPAGMTIAASIGLALVWPYFSLVNLFTDNVGLYDATNHFIYEGAVKRALPLLLAVPLVWRRLRADWRDPLALLALLFALFYAYGDVSGHWNWGRMISFEFIVVFVLLADFASDLESRMRGGELAPQLRAGIVAAAALLLAVELVNMRSGIRDSLPNASANSDAGTSRFPDYAGFFRGTSRDAVTLAGLKAGRGIPVYAGKIVGYNNPEAFVDDQKRRQNDVNRFFQRSETLADRRAIVQRYGVDYIFLDRQQPPEGTLPLAPLLRLGSLERSERGLVLIRVRR